ncbi:E2-like enzyme [Coelomomyces lativittatus]|nr:E2-like enzyme [Coelomomyces lativittatus]
MMPVEDTIPDLDDLVGNVTEDDPPPLTNRIQPTRTYDLSITYDKYYQTPRLSLMGYDEKHYPLPSMYIFQDISQDHAFKTVTLEPHPHLHVPVVSIHPCRHAEMMKKFLHKWFQQGKEIRVDQYLVFFLKFMASVLPTMDYDHTMALD